MLTTMRGFDFPDRSGLEFICNFLKVLDGVRAFFLSDLDFIERSHPMQATSRFPAKQATLYHSIRYKTIEHLYIKNDLPCLALSSENSRATSSNLAPSRSLARASSFLECFSH
jgi:hypothetical protein